MANRAQLVPFLPPPPGAATSSPSVATPSEAGPAPAPPGPSAASPGGWGRGGGGAGAIPAPRPTARERAPGHGAGDAFVVLGAATLAPEAVAALSFSQLAKRRTLEAFDEVLGARGAIGPDATPHDPKVKAFRKSLLKLRDQLDTYPHVYVRGLRDADAEPWLALRRAVDEGYDVVGDYKDLFDAQGLELATVDPLTGLKSEGVDPAELQYPRKDLERRRDALGEWAGSFFKPKRLEAHRQLLASPSTMLQNPRRRDLSELFWGGVSVGPKPSLSGLGNVARLCEAQLRDARRELNELKDVRDLVAEDAIDRFHEVRKRMRSAMGVLAQSPEIARDQTRATLLRDEILRFVGAYGAIEDLIVRRESFADGSEKKALAKRIDDAWDDLRKKQAKEDLSGTLKELEGLVR